MILIYKFFFPVSTKGNLVPLQRGYTHIKFFLKDHKGEGTSKYSYVLFILQKSGRLNDSDWFGFTEGF